MGRAPRLAGTAQHVFTSARASKYAHTRRKFAVWVNWNSHGEFVTYVVPPGKPLHVWEGVTASQIMGGGEFVLEGGARQIVVDPAHLVKSQIGRRAPTNWGYDDLGITNDLIGVPALKNIWYEKK